MIKSKKLVQRVDVLDLFIIINRFRLKAIIGYSSEKENIIKNYQDCDRENYEYLKMNTVEKNGKQIVYIMH